MTLSQFLESRFRGDIRFRGADFFKTEKVSLTKITPDDVLGTVRDGATEFHTHLQREESELRLSCDCPKCRAPGAICSHLWGTILMVDAAGLCPAAFSPGYIPPFATAAPPVRPFDEDEDFDDDLERDVFEPRAPASPRAAVVAPAKLREWDARLVELRQTLQGKDGGAATEREREIVYEIDIAQSRQQQQVVVQTSQRQRRGSGQWGKLKPMRVRPNQLGEFTGADRLILAALCGGTPERPTGGPPVAGDASGAHRFQLPYPVAETLLPALCATGRLQYLTEAQTTGQPLEWDDGAPWELSLGLVHDEEDEHWQLAGKFARGETTLDLPQVLFFVPGGLLFSLTGVSRFHDDGSAEWVTLLRRPEPLKVPVGEETEFVDRLLDMPAVPRLDLPAELQLEEVAVEPAPQLLLHSPRQVRWQRERLYGELLFDYMGTAVRASSPQGAIVQRQLGRSLRRDRAREDAAWSQLLDLGFKRVVENQKTRFDVEIQARNLGPAVRALIATGWAIRAEGQQVRQAGHLQFQVKSNIDWFELHGKVDFDGHSIPFPELLSALARGDSTVRLDDGSLGILPEEWFQQYALLAGLGATEGDHVRFTRNQVGLLDALLAAREEVSFDAQFSELRDKLQNFTGIATSDEPDGFAGTLRDYQKEGVGWLRFLQDFNFGGCLADDMGLGKTIQLLALLLERRRARGHVMPSLVVVPKSLIFNWHQEAKRFTPQLKVLEYTGLDRTRLQKQITKSDVVLTTYGTLRRDILVLKEVSFDYIVLDEAQAIKNARSQVAKAARLLKAQHRLALSGTPIENHLGDLWSIFEFLNPGMLGRASFLKNDNMDQESAETRAVVAHALKPFILRRTKRQVATELPEKTEQTIFCKMGEQQLRLYNELRDHYRTSLLGMVERDGLAKSKIHVLEALLRLRQAACHPGLLKDEYVNEPSAKMEVLSWHLDELLAEGHKVLVFSQFTSMLALVKTELDKKQIVYEYLDGQTRRRKEPVERFQNDPDCRVFLISLKAGGLGLNLTAADYVFILDPWWNPAVEAQAIDRAHRIGQQRQVFAYRLICKNTVEEKIAALQEQKKDLADAILQANNNLIQNLTAEDLALLLS